MVGEKSFFLCNTKYDKFSSWDEGFSVYVKCHVGIINYNCFQLSVLIVLIFISFICFGGDIFFCYKGF